MSGLRAVRKRPVDVSALRFTASLHEVETLVREGCKAVFVPRGYEHHLRRENEHDHSRGDVLDDAPPYLAIDTLEGTMRADVGDWVIRGVQGEFYPCKPDIFEATYVVVEPTPE